MPKTLDEHAQEMSTLAGILCPYSYPTKSVADEEDLAVLKQREITVDGYQLIVFFNHCSYGDASLKTLQIYGKDFCFLPFTVVSKCVRKFLGDEELSLVEVMHHERDGVLDEASRKIYIWTVYYDKDGNTISPFLKDSRQCCYDGLNFAQVKSL